MMSLWRRNLYITTAIQVLSAVTFNIVTPFLPFFIGELGITDRRELAMWAGILPGINALFGGIMSPVWGNLADRFGAKPMIIRCTACIAIVNILTSFVTNIYSLLALRILLGIFGGFSVAALSLVTKQTPEHRLGFALGWLQTGMVLGVVIGPIIGGFLADLLPYRKVFLTAGLIAIISVVLGIGFVHEDFHPAPRQAKEKRGLFHIFSWPLIIWVMFTVIFLSQFAVRGIEPLMPLYIKQLEGNAPALNTLTGTVVAVIGVAQVITVTVLGRYANTWGYKRSLLICLAGAAVFALPQAFATQAWQLIILRFCQGLFIGGMIPMANSLIALFTPPEKRGSVYGLTSSAFFFGNFLGPLIGGFQAALLGIRSIFYLATGLLMLNFLWVLKEVREPARAGGTRAR
ncbi:MAG: transporter, family, multidrug resistance protein [Clostridia bacterium]|nr:transporter, family, multidrug resistance protein [Clostridia bacterium]